MEDEEDPGIGVYAHVKAIEMLLVDTLALVIAQGPAEIDDVQKALLLSQASSDRPVDTSHPLYQIAVRAQAKYTALVARAAVRAADIRAAR